LARLIEYVCQLMDDDKRQKLSGPLRMRVIRELDRVSRLNMWSQRLGRARSKRYKDDQRLAAVVSTVCGTFIIPCSHDKANLKSWTRMPRGI
jgi:hypothetical protein